MLGRVPLPRPISTQPHYGEHLGDARYWGPYVREVLDRHVLPQAAIEEPFVGTFPTFLTGDVVVKLFGPDFDGGRCHTIEQAMLELVATEPLIPAPAPVAGGQLFDDGWPWPYLVIERVSGTAIRDLPVAGPAALAAAERLGPAIARLHALAAPDPVAARDLLPGLRSEATCRLRRYGLPERLLAQVPEYLADAPAQRVLVHADLTSDHLYLDGPGLSAIIDWSDALLADPWYELVALYFDGFRHDEALLRTFLAGYGRAGAEFPRCALQAVLEFQFDAIATIGGLVDLNRFGSLEDLADALFAHVAATA